MVIIHKMFLLLPLIGDVMSDGDNVTCDGVIFQHVYFDKEVIAENLGRPYNLVMHKYSGMLFFSHTVQSGTQIDFEIMACHVEKKECETIKGVPGGYAVAYDPGNDDIYFGGHDGLYKYNFLTKAAEYFSEEGKSIWGIFVRKNFYYIEYPFQKLLVYQDDKFTYVAEAIYIEIDNFYVSKHNEIYFSNKTSVYKVEKGERDVMVLNDEIVVRQITEDKYGDIYFCASDGIYIEDKPYLRLKRVAHINQAFGLTFDEHDHVIYSDVNNIHKLIPSNHSKECYNVNASSEDKKQDLDRRINLITKLKKLN